MGIQEELAQKLLAAEKAYEAKALDDAEDIIADILAKHPKEPSALRLSGLIHMDRGRLQQAAILMRSSIQQDCFNPLPFLDLGRILILVGRNEEAADFIKESLKLNQYMPGAWFLLGECLRLAGQKEKAIMAYQNVVGLDASSAAAYFGLGVIYTSERNFDNAIACNRKAIEIKSDFFEAHFNLGFLLQELQCFCEAIASYRKAIEIKPDFADAYLNLGNTLKEEGEVEEAIASYRKAIEIKPDFANAYLNLGNTLKEEGEVEEAIASYRKAIEIKPDCAMAAEFLCSALIGKGQIQDAKQVLCPFSGSKDVPIYLEWLSHYLSSVEVSFLDKLDLSDPETAHNFKYQLLRRLRSWICVADCLEREYDHLYQELYDRFGIQGLDTTDEIACFKPLAGWSFSGSRNSTLRPYASRFLKSGHSILLSSPFSSDINHLSGAGHFYLLLSSRFGSSVDLLGKRFELSLDYQVESLPVENLCLGFSAKVCDDWGPSDRSHAYVPLVQRDPGLFVAEIDAQNLLELGVNSEHFTASRYKPWDPVETAQHVSGIFLFIRSPDYPLNPKGSVTIHYFNLI